MRLDQGARCLQYLGAPTEFIVCSLAGFIASSEMFHLP